MEFNFYQHLPEILANPIGLEQVIVNLIKNGIEAKHQQVKIEIATKLEEDSIIIIVKDDGDGISEIRKGKIIRSILHDSQRNGRNRAGVEYRSWNYHCSWWNDKSGQRAGKRNRFYHRVTGKRSGGGCRWLAYSLLMMNRGYLVQLQIALETEGYVIKTASSGREAIDIGTRFRPDVIVVDWMLKHHVHGLHVVDALRTVCPNLQAILVTGFASDDLRVDAGSKQIIRFIEKPFDRDEIRKAVQQAINADPIETKVHVPAVIEIDVDGKILFANQRARELFTATHAGRNTSNLNELFLPERMFDLDEAAEKWLTVTPNTSWPVSWRVRSQKPIDGNSRLVVIRGHEDPIYVDLPVVELLLGVKDPEHTRWSFPGRIVVIDSDSMNRRFSAALLQGAGAGFYAVESISEALRLLEKDQGLEYVLLRCDISEPTLAESIEQISNTRPGIIIVGICSVENREHLTEMGIKHILPKRWRVKDLMDMFS